MAEPGPTVRRVAAGDGRLLADVRMAALADAPAAFSSTLADAVALPRDEWEARAVASAGGVDRVTFVAVEDGRGVGMAGALPTDGQPDRRHLVGMWVAPSARGQGLALRLVEEVVAWARDAGAAAVDLDVMAGNDAAIQLYGRCRFRFVDAVVDPAPQAGRRPMALELT